MQKNSRNQSRRLKQQGFTLIELLIVVAIIGILAAVGVPQYGNYLDRSSVSACQAELSSFRSAIIAESSFSPDDDSDALVAEVGINFQSCDIADGDRSDIADLFLEPVSTTTPVSTNRASADDLFIVSGNIRTDDPNDT